MTEGQLLVEARLRRPGLARADRDQLAALAAALAPARTAAQRVRSAATERAQGLMRRTAPREGPPLRAPFPVWVDRELAGFSAWYEMFPRSEGARAGQSGTFRGAARRLPDDRRDGLRHRLPAADPPHRRELPQGRQQQPRARAGDPGSPWAIGSAAGGHDAVHPDLGTIEDFDAFVAAAGSAGLEVALDYALQCSPDHPWVTEHPEWFRHRPDGSIRYAENPPKRYQDIYPINFDTGDREGLWDALRDVMLFWIAHGVRVFRVDNPHTKPFAFWEWLIAEVHRAHPDVIFLAEAFTRPRMMEQLAKVGFTQSYTYFTWRNSKEELASYLEELAHSDRADYFRPNFWVNTPDILHAFLQEGGPAAFRLRLVLAAMSPSWGMYSGYELYENTAVREGSEEYLDSEKYQLRPRDWSGAKEMRALVTRVNAIRRRHKGRSRCSPPCTCTTSTATRCWLCRAAPRRHG